MNFFKKAAALLAAAVLSLPAVSLVSASAEPGDVESGLNDGTFTYELVDGSYTITACNPSAILTEVPELVNGYAVTAIGD